MVQNEAVQNLVPWEAWVPDSHEEVPFEGVVGDNILEGGACAHGGRESDMELVGGRGVGEVAGGHEEGEWGEGLGVGRELVTWSGYWQAMDWCE